ncbi:unnamed protein product [Victoria cruziana]
MSWGLGWKRPSETFQLGLCYGDELSGSPSSYPSLASSSSISSSNSTPSSAKTAHDGPSQPLRIQLGWSAGEDEDQVALRLQSQLMVALPPPQDTVLLNLNQRKVDKEEDVAEEVDVEMKVVKKREPLCSITMMKTVGSGQQSDGVGVLTRLIRSNAGAEGGPAAHALGFEQHWRTVTFLNLSGCGLSVLPVELTRLPLLEKLYLDNNKLSLLPSELGELKSLKELRLDYNMLISVPELKECTGLKELSLEHNKLVRPLLDLRAMSELRILRLFGNPLEFLPEILPLHKLRHLTLANIRIEADDDLKLVDVKTEMDNTSYFAASRHKLGAFFSLIFRFSSCHHPLLASALATLMRDHANCLAISKDENAVRQLISMISSGNRHVVEQASSALSSLAADVSLAIQLIKADIMQPVQSLLKSFVPEELMSVLQVVVTLAFASDIVAQKMLTKEMLKSLKALCAHKNTEVQRLSLLAVGNLAFCLENRHTLVTSESLRELLLRYTVAPEPRVKKAAARALAILGENELLRRAIRGRAVGKQGLRILSMDGGGMKGMATVQILKQMEQGTGKRIHEMFDLICGTSTGGMLAVALGIKKMTLEQCEEIYKNLGKLVFTEPIPKDNEAASWREKLDQLYKSSSQSFRVVVHGSKHSADQFERLLKEMCKDEDGDLLIESAVKNTPKVFVVSTLVSVMPSQPFLFRNYQYPAGTPEMSIGTTESTAVSIGSPPTSARVHSQGGTKRAAFLGSCKNHIWEAIRASSAAPYYLDDFSDDVNRWQDGAIVANNPTIIAIREAQLLWPDTQIDCLVSVGCGSLPTKTRGKGGWRYLDTGQVLVESACSVERVEEALSTLLPVIPDIHYFRFNPVDERCGMELDETDPAVWLKLEAATEEYIQKNIPSFKSLCDRLVPYRDEEKSDKTSYNCPKIKQSVEGDTSPCLGWRRTVLLLESSQDLDSAKATHHARSLETFCSRKGIRLCMMDRMCVSSKAATAFPTPFTSPLFTGSFPSSPLTYSPELGHQRANRMDLIPPLSLDGLQSQLGTLKVSISPPDTPSSGPRQLSGLVQSLHEKLQNLPQVGIVHLALENDSVGSILSWQNDVFVVAEPGELADRFIQGAKSGLLYRGKVPNRKDALAMSRISSISALVAHNRSFQVGGITHRYIGRQTQVLEGDEEIGAFMFRRTLPAVHLTSEDIRLMVGAWRERIIICTGKYGMAPGLVKAFLDCGAKAVISPSEEPPGLQPASFFDGQMGAGDINHLENGRFVIGEEEEAEEEEMEPSSPLSDWEDSDIESVGQGMDGRAKEEDLSQFVCTLYDSLFRVGASVDVALRQALSLHSKLRYQCHLPSTS